VKFVSGEKASEIIHDGMTVAMSGWAMAGYPKVLPEIIDARRRNGENISINLITGANVPWIDDVLSSDRCISSRAPMIASRTLASQVNEGVVKYREQQMNKMPKMLKNNCFGNIDIAIIEAVEILEDGKIIPSSSSGMSQYFLDSAKTIIIELNRNQLPLLKNLHDIYIPESFPNTNPIPLTSVTQRIGVNYLKVDQSKVIYIVETDVPERISSSNKGSDITEKIVKNLFSFLCKEYKNSILPPVQLGFGTLADAIAHGFKNSCFSNVQFYCGGITDPVLELLYEGIATEISTGGIGLTDKTIEMLKNIDNLEQKIVIRNGDISNSAEIINRLSLISINTGIEIDIYGNVNSSHIYGSKVVNGIGGGAGFAQNAGLSVIVMPSTTNNGNISGIVPMVFHQDISEHDVDVIITDQGIADIRGLDDRSRAELIINECSSEIYKPLLKSYYTKACLNGGHHPQDPVEAYKWYERLKNQKTMKEVNDGKN